MSKQTRKKQFGDFDKRIYHYHVADAPWILTISQIGIEHVPDLYPHDGPQGEILTLDDGEIFDPYAPKPERKKGAPPATYPAFVLWFREFGSRRNFLLNKTNERALIAAYGRDPEKAKGKLIMLRAGKTRQGKPTVLLTPAPNGAKPGVYELPPDEPTPETEPPFEPGEPVQLSELMRQGEPTI